MQPFLLTTSAFQNQCISAIATSIANATIRVQAGPSRVSSKELMNEDECILHKTAGGLSLFERLKRDFVLYDQLLELVYEMQTEA